MVRLKGSSNVLVRRTYLCGLLFVCLCLRLHSTTGEVTCDSGKLPPPCKAGESFINICGVCVGGQTGLPETEGLDRCGVCFGENECLGCDDEPHSGFVLDSCGKCLLPDSPDWDQCVRVSRITPSVLDRAVDGTTIISLKGSQLNRTNVPDINCMFIPIDEKAKTTELPKIEMTTVEDDVIQLEIIFVEQRGLYHLFCNSSTVAELTAPNLTLTLVNSKDLSVTAVSPAVAKVEQSIQPILTIPNVAANSNILCYIRVKGATDAQILPSLAVEKDRVICSNHTAKQAHILEIGAVFTEDAANEKELQGAHGLIKITSPKPAVKKAVLSDDLHDIRVSFDQNVDGPKACEKIVNAFTLRLLGKDPECTFAANDLIIKLGSNPSLQENAEIHILDKNQIFRAFSDPALSKPAQGKAALKTPSIQRAQPRYMVTAPQFICPKQTYVTTNISFVNSVPAFVRMVSFNKQVVQYKWVANVPNMSSIPNRGQAENLRLWRNIRGLAREMKKEASKLEGNQFPVNSSWFRPGIQYAFSVSGVNILGMRGEEKTFSMKMSDKNSTIDMVLIGPDIMYADADYFVEARVFTCDETLLVTEFLYEWSVSGETAVDIDQQKGKRLRLQSGTLRGGRKYNITCVVKSVEDNSTVLASATITTETMKRGPMVILSAVEQTVGTGQTLLLDASKSSDPDNEDGDLKFQWCCSRMDGSPCVLPQPGNPVTIQSKYEEAFKTDIVEVPPNSLFMGEYNFTVYVYKNEDNVGSQSSKVLVVAGSPPTVNITADAKYLLVDPTVGITIEAEVSNIKAGCRMWWEAVEEIGFQYVDLQGVVRIGDVVEVTEDDVSSGLPREYPLYVPGPTQDWPGLKGDTKYKLRLTATCPTGRSKSQTKVTEGHADVIIQTNTPPVAKSLQVTPEQGEALRTQFEFSTDEAYDSIADMPLQYNFGYRVSGDKTNIFSSSNEDLKAYTLLPAEAGQETYITPVLQVCDSHKLCSTSVGSQVKTVAPHELSASELDKIMQMLANLLSRAQYAEALSLILTSLQTLEKMPDQTLYKDAAKNIENMLHHELKIRQNRLKENPRSFQDGLDFLDMALSALEAMPMTESIMDDLLEFKNEIFNIIRKSNNIVKYRHRRNVESSKSLKVKREASATPDVSVKNLETFLKVTELYIRHSNASYVKLGIEDLLKDLPTYMTLTCKSAVPRNVVNYGNKIVRVQVEKYIDLNQLWKDNIYLWEKVDPPKISSSSFVKIRKEIAVGQNGHLCYGNTLFPQDYLGKLQNLPEYGTDKNRVDIVHGIWIMNKKIIDLSKIQFPVQMRLPLEHPTSQDSHEFQCAVWDNGWSTNPCKTGEIINENNNFFVDCECSSVGYHRIIEVEMTTTERTTTEMTTTMATTTTPTTTTTTEPPTTTATTVTTTEQTPPPPPPPPPTTPTTTTTTTTPTTTTTTTTTPTTTTTTTPTTTTKEPSTTSKMLEGLVKSEAAYNVSFRIEEDFKKTVGNREDEFTKKLRKEILQQVPMPSNMIQKVSVYPGSIVVRLTLVDTDIKSVEEVIPLIRDVIGSGKLNVTGLDNKKLHVPPQNIHIVYPNTEEDNKIIAYAVGGTVGVSTFAVVTLMITAIVYNRKKQADRMKKLQASAQSKVPTYRKFEFEDTIDGTEASLQQYRSNYPSTGTVSTMAGFGMLTGLGTQLNLFPRNARYESQSLQGSQNSKTRQSKKTKKVQNNDDHDSGIMDSDDVQQQKAATRKRTKDRKKFTDSLVSLDNLPGTPTDDYQY